MSSQFAIMSLHAGQKNYHEVCTNYLSLSAISFIDSEKDSLSQYTLTLTAKNSKNFNLCFLKQDISFIIINKPT